MLRRIIPTRLAALVAVVVLGVSGVAACGTDPDPGAGRTFSKEGVHALTTTEQIAISASGDATTKDIFAAGYQPTALIRPQASTMGAWQLSFTRSRSESFRDCTAMVQSTKCPRITRNLTGEPGDAFDNYHSPELVMHFGEVKFGKQKKLANVNCWPRDQSSDDGIKSLPDLVEEYAAKHNPPSGTYSFESGVSQPVTYLCAEV